MSDDSSAALSPRDHARLSYAWKARSLADELRRQVPIQPNPAPGEILRGALALRRAIEDLISRAVVSERERGTTWEQVAQAAGMTRQSAHEKWFGDVRAWAATGRRSGTKLSDAKLLDAWYAQMEPESGAAAVSAGLDAVRFPGSGAYEEEQRVRGAVLHTRAEELRARSKELSEAHGTSGNATPTGMAWADNMEALADIYDELAGAEVALADDHRAEAARQRTSAQQIRESCLKRDEANRRVRELSQREQTATAETAG